MKGEDERINESVLLYFRHLDRIWNDMIAKRVYMGEYIGSSSVGQPWKRWLGTVKDC